MSGGFRLSSAFPHPRRMKSAPPEGDPGAWIRNFVGGALRMVVYKLQNKTVLEWKPRLSFPTQEEGMGFGVRGALALMFSLKNAGDLQEREPDSPFHDS